jgi:hypothetical protein
MKEKKIKNFFLWLYRGTVKAWVPVWAEKIIEQPCTKDMLRIKWTLDSNKVDFRDEIVPWKREKEREKERENGREGIG